MSLSGEELKGISTCDIVNAVVGQTTKSRFNFSYQVYEGKIIITGGSSSIGEPMKSTEVIDCNGVRGSPVIVSSDPDSFPFLNRKRHMHQSLILGGRFLFIFFGMCS